MDNKENFILGDTATLRQAVRQMDKSGYGVCFLVNSTEKLVGAISNKEIRKTLLEGYSLDRSVNKVMNSKPFSIKEGYDPQVLQHKISHTPSLQRVLSTYPLPVLNTQGQIVNLVWMTRFGKTLSGKTSRTVLLTGGAGYLGSVLTKKLLDNDYTVKVLDQLPYGSSPLRDFKNHPRYHLIEGDIRNIKNIIQNTEDVGALIHLAGIVGDPACEISPTDTIEQNLLATTNLAQVCKHFQINKFLFASSCSVYGEGTGASTEESPLRPVSLYARTKIEGEKSLLALGDENFSPTILRMATLYGPSPRPRFDLVLNLITACALREGKFKIFGGSQWRPMLHVEDAADAYITILKAPPASVKGEIFNVGSEKENYQIAALGDALKKIIPEATMEIKEENVDPRDYHVNFQKIKNTLGFSTQKTIEDGIREMIKWMKDHKIENFRNPKYNNAAFCAQPPMLNFVRKTNQEV